MYGAASRYAVWASMGDEVHIGRRIADLKEDDRPRERMAQHGPGVLSDSELLAILIATGTSKCSAIQLAQNLLMRAGNDLDALGRFSIDDFKKERGIGDAKAITLVAALELGRRRSSSSRRERVKIASPDDIFALMEVELRDKQREEMWLLYLNSANVLLRRSLHSNGGINQVQVDVRLIAREALDLHAISVAMCHNHPSGDPRPSQEDVALTRTLEAALGLFGIRLLDHLVIGQGQYVSLRRDGYLG